MTRLDANRGGVWVAFHHDGSGFVVFSTEIAALRYALANTMAVRYARFGDPDWRTQDAGPEPEYTLHNHGGVCRGVPETMEPVDPASLLGRVTR